MYTKYQGDGEASRQFQTVTDPQQSTIVTLQAAPVPAPVPAPSAQASVPAPVSQEQLPALTVSFEPYEPDEQQLGEFAQLCRIAPEWACQQLQRYILVRYQRQYPPGMISHALNHALLAAFQQRSIQNPIAFLESAVSRRMAQYESQEMERELSMRVMAMRAEAEIRGEALPAPVVALPFPSTLEREVARLKAEPTKWTGILPGLDNDHVAEVAEEFIDLPEHAKPISWRLVRKAFEEVKVRNHTSIERIQEVARAALYREAYGPPEAYLEGRLAMGFQEPFRTDLGDTIERHMRRAKEWNSTNYVILPAELVDDVVAAYPDVFDERPLRIFRRDERRNALALELSDFTRAVGEPGNFDFPARLYGNGLQQRVETRARELANDWCEKKRAEDVKAIEELEREHEKAVARLEYLRLHPLKRIPLDYDLESRVAEWPKLYARLKVRTPC